MKKNRSLSGIFLSVLLTFILCFTTGATAFAEGIQTDGDVVETMSQQVKQTSTKASGILSSIVGGATSQIEKLAQILTSSTVGDRELPIYCVDTKEKKIALSFDAAWGAEDFQNIMDILDKHKIKTTFFMTGGWVEDNPDCVK